MNDLKMAMTHTPPKRAVHSDVDDAESLFDRALVGLYMLMLALPFSMPFFLLFSLHEQHHTLLNLLTAASPVLAAVLYVCWPLLQRAERQ